MPTICPKCRTVRPASSAVPDWQCPACGVAYAKAGGDGAAMLDRRRPQPVHVGGGGDSWLAGVPWGKLIAGLAICYGAWLGYHRGGAVTSVPSGAGMSIEQMATLGASLQPSDVVMYSATWCPYCSQTKSWLAQYGFKAEICEIDKDSTCQARLQAIDAKVGVPYLIVKGHHMKNGFDSDEFKAALSKQ